MDLFQFKAVLLEISNQLTEDQLSKVKFLCQDHIGKRSLETIDSGTKLFTALGERGHLSPDHTELLGQMLQEVGRDDLFQILDAFVTGSRPCLQDETENGTVEQAEFSRSGSGSGSIRTLRESSDTTINSEANQAPQAVQH